MTESEWLASNDPKAMLQHMEIHQRVTLISNRKLWLLLFALERSDVSYARDTENQDELLERRLRIAKCDTGERFAEGQATAQEVFRARWPDRPTPEGVTDPWHDLRRYVNSPGQWKPGAAESICAIIRDIIGNPFRPIEPVHDRYGKKTCPVCEGSGSGEVSGYYFSDDDMGPCEECGGRGVVYGDIPAAFWLTPLVTSIATTIYQERTFDDLPILADALEDAGCDNERLLGHLRRRTKGHVQACGTQYRGCAPDCPQQIGPHVRGCWALDLVLGKE
jgi:hypothetical protein